MAEQALWPLVVYGGAVLVLIALVLAMSSVLGERHNDIATGEAFESGIVPVHQARFRVQAKFYLVAMLFVIFDLEAVFVITWALVAREAGWAGYIEIAVFIVILLAALAYLWRLGALDWGQGTRRGRPPPSYAVNRRIRELRPQPAQSARAAPVDTGAAAQLDTGAAAQVDTRAPHGHSPESAP